MLRALLRRALAALATLVGVLVVVFALLSAAPGDPAALALRDGARARPASPEAVAAFRAAYGLDRPAAVRLVSWVGRAARLDFGRSFRDGRPVAARIAETVPITLALNLAALLLALAAGVPLAAAAARRPGGAADRLSGLVADLFFSAPAFVTGTALLLVFGVRLGWTPVLAEPEEGLRGVALPIVTLGLAALAPVTRVVRACLLEALASPAALAAKARGEGEAAAVLRALRRSAVPLLALGASLVPQLVAGSVLVERLFAVPGTGQLLADSVFARDVPSVLGLTVVAGAAVVVASAVADGLSAVLDPRLAEGEREPGEAS